MKQMSYRFADISGLEACLASPDLLTANDRASATLVQVFSASNEPDWLAAVLERLAEALPEARVVGATTVGEVLDGQTLTGAVVVGFSFFESSTVRVYASPGLAGRESDGGRELISEILRAEDDLAGVLLLATPLSMDASLFLEAFRSPGQEFPIFGGGAGDYAAMQTSFVFEGKQLLGDGVVAVAFSGKGLNIDNQTYLGWRPLSKQMTVTKTEGMVAKEVDGKPAFDIYDRYLGIPDDENFFLNVLEFPFLLERNGRLLARVPVSVDAEGGLQFVADIREGESFRIGYGDPSLIISDAQGIHKTAKDFNPEAIFLYTCGCRRFLMQDDVELETKPFEDIAPSFGFYTYGEMFGPAEQPELLNSTMVAVSFREGDVGAGHSTETTEAGDAVIDPALDPYAKQHTRIISRLVHFVKAATGELEQANEEVKALSITDRLTGLSNRLALDEELAKHIELAKRYDQPFSCVLLDVDHFKSVNDTHGHLVGDDVLIRVAGILRNVVRDVDILGRWGGEEFLVILPHTDLAEACQVAEKLRREIAGTDIPIVGQKTASFGVASYAKDDSVEGLLCRADKALYQAKGSGRNCVVSEART